MKWSRYNKLFKSKKYGWLLYNSASNTFAEIAESLYPEILKIKKDTESYNFDKDPGLYFQLRTNGIIVEDRGDENFRDILKMKRLQNNFDNSNLLLTIAPTSSCNFNCTYCYEESRPNIFMSDETEDSIIAMIKRYKGLKYLAITWYGGEPLLDFNRICSITKKIKELDINFASMIVTNAFLLDKTKIEKFEDLKIKTVQITIDGNEDTHNVRRPLIDGGKTYQTILQNTDLLVKGWKGELMVRINTDESNKETYHKVHKMLKERYGKSKDVRLTIYPGIVHDHNQSHPDISCLLDREDEANFTIEQYKKYGIDDLRTFPGRYNIGCTALRRNAFVIGPEGEFYKCWDDVGIKERVVGSLKKGTPWNIPLIANYMVGSSYLDDPKCLKCFYFPVCDGGCPNVRLKNYVEGKNIDVCSKFKNRLEDILEIYYEKKQKILKAAKNKN